MRDVNPLDVNEQFFLSLMNPNPTSSKNKDGPVYRVSFEMEQEMWQLFMDADTKGMILDCVMQSNPEGTTVFDPHPPKAKTVKGPHGDFARWFYGSGALRMPKVWEALGSEMDHKHYIQTKNCVICGRQDLNQDTGEMLCEEAHVRDASNSGTGFKPGFVSVPMCHQHHADQHNHGYASLYQEYCHTHKQAQDLSPDLVEEWMKDRCRKHAMDYIEEWCKLKFYEYFGIDTLTNMSPDMFDGFCNLYGIDIHIPTKFLPPGQESMY